MLRIQCLGLHTQNVRPSFRSTTVDVRTKEYLHHAVEGSVGTRGREAGDMLDKLSSHVQNAVSRPSRGREYSSILVRSGRGQQRWSICRERAGVQRELRRSLCRVAGVLH